MTVRLRPVPNAPALVVSSGRAAGRSVVIADLHLGLAADADAPLGPPGASAPELAEALLQVCRRTGARRVIVAGDVKHPIVGVPPWLRRVVFDFFATLLSAEVAVDVVLGNHDVGLVRHLPREVRVHPASGWHDGGLGVFHGHRWPAPAVLAQQVLVAGHLHPGYRFAPTAGMPQGKLRCWVRVRYARDVGRDLPGARKLAARELIVVPPFHPLAGVEALNRERPERGRTFLYRRFLARGDARAYLLDGTDLGPLPEIPTPPDR